MKMLRRNATTIIVATAFGAGAAGLAYATDPPPFKKSGTPDAGDVRAVPGAKDKPLTTATGGSSDVTPKQRPSSQPPGDVRGMKGHERVMEDVKKGEPAEAQKFRASSTPDAGDVRAIRPGGGAK